MASRTVRRKVTAKEFLRIDFGPDQRFELVDGVIHAMAGGTRAQARVPANLMSFLGQRLRGSGCRPYGPDFAIKTGPESIRYPDLLIDCGSVDGPEQDDDLVASDPRIVFEVLSPSTRGTDQEDKLKEYTELPTIDTVVFIDPDAERVRVVQRIGEAARQDHRFGSIDQVHLPALRVTIAKEEIFARD
jgi:Uma2 family endonuclease